MATTKARSTGETFRIVSDFDTDGTLTVEAAGTGARTEVVDYVDELVRERLKLLSPGSFARLELARPDGNDGPATVTRVYPETPLGPVGAD
jgi:hypothetical protein